MRTGSGGWWFAVRAAPPSTGDGDCRSIDFCGEQVLDIHCACRLANDERFVQVGVLNKHLDNFPSLAWCALKLTRVERYARLRLRVVGAEHFMQLRAVNRHNCNDLGGAGVVL